MTATDNSTSDQALPKPNAQANKDTQTLAELMALVSLLSTDSKARLLAFARQLQVIKDRSASHHKFTATTTQG